MQGNRLDVYTEGGKQTGKELLVTKYGDFMPCISFRDCDLPGWVGILP